MGKKLIGLAIASFVLVVVFGLVACTESIDAGEDDEMEDFTHCKKHTTKDF